MTSFATIESALDDLRQGRMLVLVDDDSREQEGDLIIAAEKVTPAAINFMAKYARGVICLSITEETVNRLQIPLMPVRNNYPNQAAFTVSIEAKQGVSTGVSAADRSHTIKVAVDPQSKPGDISMPGHVFPLQARKGGVLVRAGHTEGSIDLAKLAGLRPAAVICEIMNDDGTMARRPELEKFAKQHDIKIIAINDLIAYRLAKETIIEEVASADLPLDIDEQFTIKIFRNHLDGSEHMALVHKDFAADASKPTLVRIHSECLTGDVFSSQQCDCGQQLKLALTRLSAEKGILLYMRQEGRGIGLVNKIKAYQLQQTHGLDTIEANERLGFQADHRCYGMSAQMLKALGVLKVRLMTNNPNKISEINRFGIEVVERIALEIEPNKNNMNYLKTKRDKLGHLLKK